jgi:hypothetical protein
MCRRESPFTLGMHRAGVYMTGIAWGTLGTLPTLPRTLTWHIPDLSISSLFRVMASLVLS